MRLLGWTATFVASAVFFVASATFLASLAACGDGDTGAAFAMDSGTPDADAGAAPEKVYPVDIDVVITADNAYSIGWGDDNGLQSFNPDSSIATAGNQIYSCPIGVGPEAHVVPAKDAIAGGWIYVVSWCDLGGVQGLIAQVNYRDGEPIYTGADAWEVCATGVPYPTTGGAGPDKRTIEREIAKCNSPTSDVEWTSHGWVGVNGAITPGARGKLALGQDNESDVDLRVTDDVGRVMTGPGLMNFAPVCKQPANGRKGMGNKARWIWYAPSGYSADPFVASEELVRHTFLIFRLPRRAIPPPPSPG